MAGGGGGMRGSRELDQTPTWAVSLVCAIIVIVSLLLEKTLHQVGKAFSRRKKFALLEALEKIKAELMVLGFISLILSFGQNYITRICIPEKFGNTMLPCDIKESHSDGYGEDHRRRLLWHERRNLVADHEPKECKIGYVPLISIHGLHELHIFIFFLAIFHVTYSASTMMLGRMKIREWRVWETECANENQKNDLSIIRLTHETSFVRDHTSSWTTNPILFHIACFFRHMLWSVQRADYLTLRHGFISVHLAPGTKFDFQKYIKRSLEDDFKVIVGIPPLLWFAAVVYLLLDVKGSQAMFLLSIMPLLTILAVGTKLQSIITRMAIEIQQRNAVIQGIPLVQVSDEHFWFNWPQNFTVAVIRVCTGFAVQFLCSYITLPLYALVTQMGSHMKRAIFDEQTSKALVQWHKKAKKNRDHSHHHPRTQKLGGSPEGSVTSVGNDLVEEADESNIEMGENSTSPKETASVVTRVDTPGENTAPNNQCGGIDLSTSP